MPAVLTPPRPDEGAVSVLIADDHEVVRRGLRQILAETPDIVLADEAASAPDVMRLVRERSYDVVVLDLSLPGTIGVELLENVKRERPDVPVLVLSMHAEEQHAARVLRAGAAGFLPKETAADELVQAIYKVHRGGRYVTPRAAEKLARDLGHPTGQASHEA
jgi:DNA-binding NarL/FixJ family response regulator